MNISETLRYFEKNASSCWDPVMIARSAITIVPDLVLGKNADLLRSDSYQQWFRWFIESFVDPRSYDGTVSDYLKVFADVWNLVNKQLCHLPKPERQEVASCISRLIYGSAQNQEAIRTAQSGKKKRLLLDLSGDPPRCYHCGIRFLEESINDYLGIEKYEHKMPHLFDVLRPSGIIRRDFLIEIDHILPFSRGGGDDDNLRLSCGWCNRQKSNYTSLYDVSGVPIRAGFNKIGITSIPHPFWSIRLLSTRKKCEHHEGCSNGHEEGFMTVAPILLGGALNPSNLMVTCLQHDPLGVNRFQSLAVIQKIWKIENSIN